MEKPRVRSPSSTTTATTIERRNTLTEKEEIAKAIMRRQYTIFDHADLGIEVLYVNLKTKKVETKRLTYTTSQYHFRPSTVKFWLKKEGFEGHILETDIISRKNHYRKYKVTNIKAIDFDFEEVL